MSNGPITSRISRGHGSIVSQPVEKILQSSGTASGNLQDAGEWRQLAAGLEKISQGTGKLLESYLEEQTEEDVVQGRALAFKEGLKYRKHAKKALVEAEKAGLFNGLRPDVRNSFAAHYGANLAKEETFDANLAKDFNQVLSQAVDDQKTAEEFQQIARDFMGGRVAEMLESVPDNVYARDRGFIPIAEQKVNAAMVKAQADFAKLTSQRYVESTEMALYNAFETTHYGNAWDNISGLNVGKLKTNLNVASKFFSTGRFDTNAPYPKGTIYAPTAGEAELEKQFPDVKDAPKDTLPVEINRPQFYFQTYQKWLNNKILPEEHPRHLQSVTDALKAVNTFYDHQMYGTGTPMKRTDQVDDLDLYRMQLTKKKLAAEKAYEGVVSKAATDATSYMESMMKTVVPRWIENGVRAPDGKAFTMTNPAHVDWFMELASKNELTLNGPSWPNAWEKSEENPEGTIVFGFNFEDDNPYGPPTKIVAEQLTEGFKFRNRPKIIQSVLSNLTQRSSFKTTNFNKVKAEATEYEKTFIESGLKNLIKQQSIKSGQPITRDSVLKWAQDFEKELDKKQFLSRELGDIDGISSGQRYNFSFDSVLKNTLNQLENLGYDPIDSNDVAAALMEDIESVDATSPNKLRELRNRITNSPNLTLTQKKEFLNDLDEMGDVFRTATDLSKPEGRDYVLGIMDSVVSLNPSIPALFQSIELEGNEAQKNKLNLANASLRTVINPQIRKLMVERARMLNSKGISMQDAVDTRIWREIILSEDTIELEGADGKSFKINGIAQDISNELNTKIRIQDMDERDKQFLKKAAGEDRYKEMLKTGISPIERLYISLFNQGK